MTGALVMHALRHPSPRAHLSPGSERITRIKRPTFPYSNLTRIRWLSGAKIRHRDGLQTNLPERLLTEFRHEFTPSSMCQCWLIWLIPSLTD